MIATSGASTRRAGWVAGVFGLLLTVVACDGVANPVVDETEPGLAEVTVDDRCEEVDDELLEMIQEGLRVDAELAGAHGVESEEEDIAFVAAELEGEGHPDEPPIGIWAVRGGLDAADPEVLAVNAIAREESEWPFDEEITEKVEGGEVAKVCVDGEAQ